MLFPFLSLRISPSKETDTFVNDYKVIDKAVKKSYSDWLNKRVREDNISG
jgi:hypothetical protein